MNELDDFVTPCQDNEETTTLKKKETNHSLWDYINDICYDKSLLALKEEEKQGIFPPEYNQYIINTAMGNYRDTVLIANTMNMYDVPKKAHYLFYTHIVPACKRYAKWYKTDNSRDEALEALGKYYGWSKRVADINLSMFSKKEIATLIANMNKEQIVKSKTKSKSKEKRK